VTVALPEQPSDTAFTSLSGPFGAYALFVASEYATNAPNPLEAEEGFGRLFSLAGPEPETFFSAVAGNPDAIDLVYSQSHSTWVVLQTSDFVLDPLNDAYYVWIPDSAVLAAADRLHLEGAAHSDWMASQALLACDRYDDWQHGRVYSFQVFACQARYDNDGQIISSPELYYDSETEPLYYISNDNLYDWDLARAEMQDTAESVADALAHPELAL
jgi:hypothetical protein